MVQEGKDRHEEIMSLDFSLSIRIDTGGDAPYDVWLYDGNFTHNVVNMWEQAGVYNALYMSDDKEASTILDSLTHGVFEMKTHPSEFTKMNPSNGWGTYPQALAFLKEVLEAVKSHPKAIIHVSK